MPNTTETGENPRHASRTTNQRSREIASTGTAGVLGAWAVMTLYFVAMFEDHPEGRAKIKDEWPDRHHFIDDQHALISIPPSGISAPGTVYERIFGQDIPVALVIKMPLDSVHGALSTSAVDWIKDAEK